MFKEWQNACLMYKNALLTGPELLDYELSNNLFKKLWTACLEGKWY